MVRKYSVLFVGTSAARGSAARLALAAHGYDVSVEAPASAVTVHDGAHDVIAFDAVDGGGLLVVNARCGTTGGRQRHVADLQDLPQAVRDVLAAGSAANDMRAAPLREPELHELLEALPGVIFRCGTDPGGRVGFISAQVAALCGVSPRRLGGRSARRLLALVHPGDRQRVLRGLREAAEAGGGFALEHRVRTLSGETRWVAHNGRLKPDGELESFVMDVTERKREERELAWLANHDALTGVANRGLFMEQVGKSMRRAARHDEMVACLFLDLDRFKQVNDTHGHAFGDELLVQVSDRLKRCIRGNDMIGRLGGDEFAVLLDGIVEPQDAAAAAAKILEELNRPCIIHGRRLSLSASIGISCYPGDARDRAALLRNADAAMYAVKRSGRHGYRFHSAGLSGQAVQSLALANALRDALRQDGLHLLYQPRVALDSGRVQALEVLTHWRSAEFGDVPPLRLFGAAEEGGLTPVLGEWVLAQACTATRERDAAGLPRVRTCVNVSPQQFRDGVLVEQVEQALRCSGLAAERLELEIAEAAIMHNPGAAAETLRRLKAMNVRLSVDGFGSGFTSLHLLKKLHIDYLKLDRSIIGGVPHNGDDAAIVEAVVAMAHHLRLGVVAQGIETEEQGAFARAAGCEEGQGYLYFHPSPDADVRRFLASRVH